MNPITSYISKQLPTYVIVNQEDTEPLINKYHKMKSAQLAQIPLIGVGSIAQRKDAEHALELGYDLLSVGKAYLMEPQWTDKISQNEEVEQFVDIHDQKYFTYHLLCGK